METLTSGQDENVLTIGYELTTDGFSIKIPGLGAFSLKYQDKVWPNLPVNLQKTLAENFIYSRTAPLGLTTGKSLNYEMPEPLLKNFTDFGIRGDLAHVSFANQMPLGQLNKLFKTRKVFFLEKNKNDSLEPEQKTAPEKALLAMSFGKDSLLTYGLVKELGIDYRLVYVNEMEGEYSIENEHKRQIIRAFEQENNEQVEFMEDNADTIFYDPNLKVKVQEFDNSNGMLAFSLEFLPLAYYHQAKYLILGNEKNLDDFWRQEGAKAYPSFDQSSAYALRLNKELKQVTGDNYQVVSLVEGIYNLAEMKILYSRYPQLLKYVMSCAQEMTREDRWCNSCPMCAKAYLYSLAVGGDPKKIGFQQDLLEQKYEQLYPLFNLTNRRAYEMPPEVFEEQLLAFLLAYRQGYRGSLIDLFVKKYLAEAKRREKSLRRKFFKIYPLKTVPKHWQTKLLNIYQEELKNFV